jgi:hypothetical protein
VTVTPAGQHATSPDPGIVWALPGVVVQLVAVPQSPPLAPVKLSEQAGAVAPDGAAPAAMHAHATTSAPIPFLRFLNMCSPSAFLTRDGTVSDARKDEPKNL